MLVAWYIQDPSASAFTCEHPCVKAVTIWEIQVKPLIPGSDLLRSHTLPIDCLSEHTCMCLWFGTSCTHHCDLRRSPDTYAFWRKEMNPSVLEVGLLWAVALTIYICVCDCWFIRQVYIHIYIYIHIHIELEIISPINPHSITIASGARKAFYVAICISRSWRTTWWISKVELAVSLRRSAQRWEPRSEKNRWGGRDLYICVMFNGLV